MTQMPITPDDLAQHGSWFIYAYSLGLATSWNFGTVILASIQIAIFFVIFAFIFSCICSAPIIKMSDKVFFNVILPFVVFPLALILALITWFSLTSYLIPDKNLRYEQAKLILNEESKFQFGYSLIGLLYDADGNEALKSEVLGKFKVISTLRTPHDYTIYLKSVESGKILHVSSEYLMGSITPISMTTPHKNQAQQDFMRSQTPFQKSNKSLVQPEVKQ